MKKSIKKTYSTHAMKLYGGWRRGWDRSTFPYINWTGGWVGPKTWPGRIEHNNLSPPPGHEPRTVQPVA